MERAKAAYIYCATIMQVTALLIAIFPYLLDKDLWFVWSILGLMLAVGYDFGSTKRIERWSGFGGKINE